MDLDAALKKIRTQIKYGRVMDAEAGLRSPLGQAGNTNDKARILDVLALGLLRQTGDYKSAIPVLRRLLELDIPEDVRQQAVGFLHTSIHQENLQPSEPDRSNRRFLAFMQFVREGRLFAPASVDQLTDEVIIVDDLDAAKQLAWHQEIAPPFESWNDLRTEASKDIHNACYANKIKTTAAHDELAREIGRLCEQRLSPTMMHFYDDIEADLTLIGLGMLVDVVPPLHATMWRAYQNRTYPCGWRGEFPDGRLCVFANR